MSIILANLALLLGPIIYRFVRENKIIVDLIDGFIFISIGGLVLQHLLPDAIGQNGLWVVLIAFLSFLGPNFIEAKLSSIGQSVHKGVLLFGLLGLCFHETLDGAALVESTSSELNAAIIIHRIPVGLTIWCILKPYFGSVVAFSCLLLMILMTFAGFFWFDSFQSLHDASWLTFVQAAAAGAVLHVVIFRFHLEEHSKGHDCCHDHAPREGSRISLGSFSFLAEGFGNLLGFLFILVMAFFAEEKHGHTGFWSDYLKIFIESSYALFLGYLIGALLYVLVPKISLNWLKSGGEFFQAIKGMIFGLPLPVCSCGVLPIYESLARRKIPIAAGFAFLLATPELGVDAILLSFPLLGFEITVLRLLAVIVFTLFVSLIAANFAPKQSKTLALNVEDSESSSTGLRLFFDSTFKLVENTGSWILLGILIAVLAENLVDKNLLISFAGWDVIVFAIFGIFIYVCAAGSTPLVAILIANGLSVGAGIAFLLTGPATNVSTFGVLARLHSRKLAWIFCFTSAIASVSIGFFINYFFCGLRPIDFSSHSHQSTASLFFPIVVAILMIFTIAKVGARQFFSKII